MIGSNRTDRFKFDSYIFPRNPDEITIIKKDKYNSSVKTYSGISYFSWGLSIVGKELELFWELMDSSQFASLNTFYENDSSIVFDPQDGTSQIYNIEIKEFDGKYFYKMKDELGTYRKDVRMILLILSEV